MLLGSEFPSCDRSCFSSLEKILLLSITCGTLQASDQTDPAARGGTVRMPGILERDPASGAATLYVPLGPGIGSPMVRYIPALVGRFAPQVGMAPGSGGQMASGHRPTLLATTAFGLSPGSLDLPLVPEAQWQGPEPLPGLSWTYPDGSGGSLGREFSFEVCAETILRRFGYGSSVTLGCLPHFGSEASLPFLLPGASGDFLLALSEEPLFPVKNVTCANGKGEWGQWARSLPWHARNSAEQMGDSWAGSIVSRRAENHSPIPSAGTCR